MKSWNKDKAGHPVLDDLWMQHRLALFSRYCIPTIAGQSEHAFQWVIYCGTNTKSVDLRHIEAAVSAIPGVMIRKVGHQEEMISDLKLLISSAPTPFVITSRVDNDDGLGKNYIKTIREHFKETDKWLLNFTGGILYDPNAGVMTSMKNSQRNHYTSLIEENKSAQELITVLGFPHDHPPPEVHIENISGEGSWLKIIHERNMKSQLKGKPVFKIKESFFAGVDKKKLRVSIGNTFIYVLTRALHKL